MPLKIRPPRQGKTPYWSIRGHYLDVRVEKSTGTPKRAVAQAQLRRLEGQIERGEYPPQTTPRGLTFAEAAVAYMEQGGSRRYMIRLMSHFGDTDINTIDQARLEAAALAICPTTTSATRNVTVYTPVSAILHHAGLKVSFRRPKGANGRVVTDWISDSDAAAVIRAADQVATDFGLLLRFLLYTGVRLNEALKLCWADIDLESVGREEAWMRRLKGGIASPVRLRADLVAGLRVHREARLADGSALDAAALQATRVFRFRAGGHLKHLLTRAKLGMLGLACPARRPTGWRPPPHRLAWLNFHSFRHTWATWMRRAGTDVEGLVATGNWRDPRSAARYAHAVARDEWSRVEDLPSVAKS